MDTITAGNLCAFTIEAARRGKIDHKMDYGDVDAIAELLKKSRAKKISVTCWPKGYGSLPGNGIWKIWRFM